MRPYVILALLVLAAFAVSVLPASAARPAKPQEVVVTVPAGTEVPLVFDQGLSSQTAKAGDTVRLHVAGNVIVNGYTVLRDGTAVNGVVARAEKRKRYGVGGKLRIALNPVSSHHGAAIPLQPRSESSQVSGKTARAAAGVVLGPVGLVSGYFVSGKVVTIKPGDALVTQVAKPVVLRIRTAHRIQTRPMA